MKAFNKIAVIFLVLFQVSLWGQDSIQTTSACWSKGNFYECDKYHAPHETQIITDLTLYCELPGISCYGHALLDGLLPLYTMLKKEDLLDKPINLAIKIQSDVINSRTVRNILQLIKDVFHFKNVIILQNNNSEFYFDNLILNDYGDRYSGFYRAFPDSHKYMKELKDFGIQDNIVFRDTQTTDNIMKEFVEYVISAYKIQTKMIKNRILIPDRISNRKISNLSELVNHLTANGYDVEVLDFEKLSIKEQIAHTMQAQYLVGTYGSNLVNAIFLAPEANVVILWHKYAKYFWSRKYCIIHSAFLSMGVQLIEFDKLDYDLRDVYTNAITDPEFFYRQGTQIFLRPEKASIEEILKYPLPAMYDLTNVNLYIQPTEVVQLLEKARFLNNEPCLLAR